MIQLSIIIPAHNEEQRLPGSLDRILAFLNLQPYQSEILVVENGSSDRTADIARMYADKNPNLKVIVEEQAGKGLAVRSGMFAATGTYRFICDADLSMPIEQVNRFLPPECPEYDIAIASREIKGSRRHNEPEIRHLIGRAYNLLVRWLAVPGLQDTQCGFKSFHKSAVDSIFPIQRLDGWAFDVELLFLAQKQGMRIVEIPIDWYYMPGSRISILKDSINMFSDLFAIRRGWRKGLYDPGDTRTSSRS